MANQLKVKSIKLKVFSVCSFLLCFFLFNNSFSQVVEETIQLDTITETIKVIYRPDIYNETTRYTKRVGVFADDTSQVAIEKTYIRDALNGIYKVNYPSGKPKVKAVYVNGNPSGEFTWYKEDGVIRVKGVYLDSLKHGFWAYKYLKIYGRYKQGKKHGAWYKLDANRQKIKSWYSNGNLVRGKGFETNDYVPEITDTTNLIIVAKDTNTQNSEVSLKIREEYEQVVDYLKNNAVLRKRIKAHFGSKTADLLKFKKCYINNVFQFSIYNTIMPLSMDRFIEKSEKNKIVVAKIDSIVKNTPDLGQLFSNSKNEQDDNLDNYSSKKEVLITVYFSDIVNQLMRVDVVWNKEKKEFNSKLEQLNQIESDKKYSILLYFNNKGDLAGAEYQ